MRSRERGDDEQNMDAKVAASLLSAIQQGATLKDIQGVSSDMMDGIYAYAYQFYQQGRLEDAEAFFRLLCMYDFYNPEYPMGLAAVFQLKEDHARAIDLYALAFSLSKQDYRPMFYSGQCYLFMGKAPMARQCFKTVLESAPDERLKQMAASYLAGLDEIDAKADQAEPAPGDESF